MAADITQLCPALQIIYKEWQMQCVNAGLNTHAIVTYRSPAAQDKAKAEGLSNAGAGESPHNCCDTDGNPASRAFDYGVFEQNDDYVSNGTDPRYALAGNIGKILGLNWGGNWHHPDFDHLEMPDYKEYL